MQQWTTTQQQRRPLPSLQGTRELGSELQWEQLVPVPLEVSPGPPAPFTVLLTGQHWGRGAEPPDDPNRGQSQAA